MVKVITDSACDLPSNIVGEYNIDIVPMSVTFGDEFYLDGVDISTEEFYHKLEKAEELPTTAQPSIMNLTNVIKAALEHHEKAVVITMSSGLSGTYQTACTVKANFTEEEQKNITVIDSLKASLGQGLLVFEAAKMAQTGWDMDSIVREVKSLRPKICCEFTVNTLDYLIKGGRVSKLQGAIGSILDIKPLLTIEENGTIVQRERLRGRKKSIRRLVEIMEQEGRDLTNQTIGISHSRSIKEAEKLADEIREKYNVKDIIIGEMTATVGTHTGPGCMGLVFSK